MRLVIGNKMYSSWSMRPWMVMKAFRLGFEEELVQLRTENTPDRLRRVSPSSKVPVLIDGATVVWDSLAIIEYVADSRPDLAIWPRDRLARAHARSASAEMHSGFQNLRAQCPMTIAKRFAPRQRSPEVMADVRRVTELWNEARTRFGSKAAGEHAGPFLYGAFSAADGMYAPVVTRFHTYSITVDPVSEAYMAALRAHPAFREWLAGAVAEPWIIGENDEPVIEDLRAGRQGQ